MLLLNNISISPKKFKYKKKQKTKIKIMTCNCGFNQICVNYKCIHKDLWSPTVLEIFSYILLPIMIGVSNVGG